VYTNLVAVSEGLLKCFAQHKVALATSIYSNRPEIHDFVTAHVGSWARTVANLDRVVSLGIPIRASIVEMDINRGQTEATLAWLRTRGVSDIGVDRLRHFGRGNGRAESQMSELCGNCSSGTMCISPE